MDKLRRDRCPRVDKSPDTKNDDFDVFIKGERSNGDLIGVCADGKEVMIDPFVGCAWDYAKKDELIGKNLSVKGFWGSCSCSGFYTFLVEEKGLEFIN